MRKVLLVLLPAVILSPGCRDFAGAEKESQLTGIEWEMRYFEQASGALVPVGANAITLEFLEDGSLEGRGYAPDWPWWPGFAYRSTYDEGPNNHITIERAEYTRPPAYGLTPHPSRWPEYWLALSLATSYQTDGFDLTLFYGENEALHFTANPAK